MPRYLTKSRFKLALECPTKLYYTGNPDYLDSAVGNTFMAALAEGGYQVGALACAMHPDGELVDAVGHDEAVAHTQQLLARDNVTIFEAALRAGNLFVRVDILRKRGNHVELIEVKAKSYEPAVDADLRNGKGALSSKWLPYLNDVAFQTHVARLALPEHWHVGSALMLADKSAVASVAGLNQRFRVRRRANGGTQIVVAPGTDASALGAPLLRLLPVDDAVSEILAGTITVAGHELPFAHAVQELALAYVNQVRLQTPPGAKCGACQFKAPAPGAPGEPRSGFHECWSQAFRWTNADFAGGTVLDLWNCKSKDRLIEQGVLHLRAVTMEHLKLEDEGPGVRAMSAKLRQWYQCHGGWPGGGEAYFDAEGMAAAMSEWRWPLHFIDFETSSVAIPFDAGRRPYETIAFQFSHHVMHEDGRVEHRTQFLEATPGVDPCLPFLRALRVALSSDRGTVFRWADHENTVLNQLRRRLLVDNRPPADRYDLVSFIESITTRKQPVGDGREVVIHGKRSMVDLRKLAERHYFHPLTQGSSSLKKVLPALMRSSARLRELYEAPAYGGPDGIPSLNFGDPIAWWVAGPDGTVRDPYELLPLVFAELSPEQQANLEAAVDAELHEGGAAMTAYARLQFEDIDPAERQAIHDALLKYCELDTLAMVMAVQAWSSDMASRAVASQHESTQSVSPCTQTRSTSLGPAMNPDTYAYISEYIAQLDQITTPGQAHGQLGDWLWRNRDRVQGVTSDLNAALSLNGAKKFQAHIPTFAVGDLCGMLLVSANPGYDARLNGLENDYRCRSVAHNLAFCSQFFTEFPTIVGGNPWWTRALGCAYQVQMNLPPAAALPNRQVRWAWAAERSPLPDGGYASVGNVDLLPFHSTADGFGQMNKNGEASNLLRLIALATLRAVLRLEPAPRLTFIASSGGAALLAQHYHVLGLVLVTPQYAAPYANLLTVYQDHAGRSVVTFARQIFAGNFAMAIPPGFTWDGLANLLRPLATPPY